MTKSEFLVSSKCLIKDIVSSRIYLLKTRKGHLPFIFAEKHIKNIDYALSKIKQAEDMKAYLLRKKDILKVLINARNKKQHRLLSTLIETDFF